MFTPISTPASVPLLSQMIVLSEGQESSFDGDWPDRKISDVCRAELHSFTVDAPWARALICVGGGYTKLMYDKEGTEVALWLNSLGVDAHILVHRLPGAVAGEGSVYPKDIALTDGLAALDHLASETAALPLFHIGLSSGGHLAGVMACQNHSLKSSGLLIGYAPINANHRDHKFPEGKADYPPVEKQDFYDDWPIGLAAYPHAIPQVPVFLAYALHDKSVPIQHALRMIEMASSTGRDVDAHVFGDAPHGFALRSLSGTQGAWPELAAAWMRQKAHA